MAQKSTIKDDVIRVRVQSRLKKEAGKILNNLGMNYSDAFTLFLTQVSLHKGLPFEVKIPNKETLAAMQDIQNNENLASYETPEALFEEMEKW